MVVKENFMVKAFAFYIGKDGTDMVIPIKFMLGQKVKK